MPLGPGARLGPYEVVAAIGAGGMGEVYRARDTRLDRTVAIKILPAAVAGDPIFRERFDREARAVAALNHPHICALYDIGEDAGTAFLVMEHLEGETLADRLTKGPLPIDQAVKYAIQIAEALDKAHRAGIVHRDLKPGNIMICRGGPSGPSVAKLLDFGLAKTSPVGALSGLSLLPTAHSPVTAQGTILGTLQYMAPEQVEGREADARSDIFAFGAIVYEMVTGKRAFEGKSQASVIASILDREPPAMSSLQPLAPEALDHVVQRCLAKDPEERWQTIADVMRELVWTVKADTRGRITIPPPAVWRTTRQRLVWLGAGAGVAVAAFTLAAPFLRPAPVDVRSIRLSIVPPSDVVLTRGTNNTVAVVSPDGRRVAFIAQRAGVGPYQLWVRSLDAMDSQPLAGTDAATLPFWSPDSRMLGFYSFGQLRAVDASSGPVQSICGTSGFMGGTWSRDNTIVFATGGSGATSLFQVRASGGKPTLLALSATLGTTVPRYPAFLPDSRHFVFFASPSNTVWIGSIDSTQTTRLLNADSQAQYVGPSHLLVVRQGTLVDQPFDAAKGALSGEAMPIAQQVTADALGYATFSASESGTLVYRTGAANTKTQLTWLTRNGQPAGTVGPPGVYRNPALSPDGTRLAVEETDPQSRTQDIWLFDLGRGIKSRFTFDPGNDIYPVWSPDGTRVVFASDRTGGQFNLFQKPANGAADEELLAKSLDPMAAPYSWSPDGRYIVFRSGTTSTSILSLAGDRKAQPLLSSDSSVQVYAQVSPDGRWIAYSSNESGINQVYVRSFPVPGGKWQISQDGGTFARWRGDGKELFYYGADGRLFAIPVDGDTAVKLGNPTPLFDAHMLNGPNNGVGIRHQYDVSRDGKRLLLNMTVDDAPPTPITVVLNWAGTIRQ
jgi:eukaryotic-like serine/threonine-protein kinase